MIEYNNNENNSSESFPLLFPEREDRHERCKPPKEAYLFFPKVNELMDEDAKNPKNTRRKIFDQKGDNCLTVYETNRLESLKEELEKNKIIGWTSLSESEILRFLQSTSFDNLKTIELLKEHISWKQSNFPIKISRNIDKIINSGFMYIHGRDNHYRPIIVVNLEKYMKLSQRYNYNDFVQSIIYSIGYLEKYMLIPGQVEQWVIIADLSNVSLLFLPSDLIKMLKVLQFHYRARLHVLFVIGMSPLLNALWSLIKKLIDEHTNRKVKFIKNTKRDDLFEFINREQIEEKYGGFAKNIDEEYGYFPPEMSSETYLKDFDNRDEILVTEEKYLDLHKEERLSVVSPYLKQMILNKKTYTKSETESNYSDARSYLPGVYSNILDGVSEYENCRENNKSTMEIEDKIPDTEENLIINQEILLSKKKVINKMASSQNIKDYVKSSDRELYDIKAFNSKTKEVSFENVIRHSCCAPKGKCIIF